MGVTPQTTNPMQGQRGALANWALLNQLLDSFIKPDGSGLYSPADFALAGFAKNPIFAPGKIGFCRAKIGNPGHIASVNYAGSGFQTYDWSIDPNWWTWWVKVSPDGTKLLAMRTADADVSGTNMDDITKASLWLFDGSTGLWTKLIDKPSLITNPDGSTPAQHGTVNWLTSDLFIMFRGGIRSGGANAAVIFDLDGKIFDVVADITSVSVIDTAPFPLHTAFALPIISTGTDANVRQLTGTTTNGNTSFSTSGAGNALSANDAGRFILGPGIAPGTYLASVTNSTTGVLSANSGAAAGTGTFLLYPEATTVVSSASAYIGRPMIAAIIGANQEVFAFPQAQTHEEGVSGLPKGFFKFTSNASSGLLDNDPAPDPSGTYLAFLTKMDNLGLAGTFGPNIMRIDDGISGSGTKPHALIGITTTDRGAPDIVDVSGNYTSKLAWAPKLNSDATRQWAAHRFVADGQKQSYDTGAPASYLGIFTAKHNPHTNVASAPATAWADDHISVFPVMT